MCEICMQFGDQKFGIEEHSNNLNVLIAQI